MEDKLAQRYIQEGISPDTNAFYLIDGKIYMSVAGMEIKAMRSGVLAGKSAVRFLNEIETENPFSNKTINVPTEAIATYSRLIMDVPREFESDPVQFFEYAKKRWHFEKPFMFLGKIARACALRHAFPDIFAGVISYEEQQCELGFEQTESVSKPSPPATQKPVTEIIADAFGNHNLPAAPSSVHDLVASVFNRSGTIEVLDGPTHVHLPEGRG